MTLHKTLSETHDLLRTSRLPMQRGTPRSLIYPGGLTDIECSVYLFWHYIDVFILVDPGVDKTGIDTKLMTFRLGTNQRCPGFKARATAADLRARLPSFSFPSGSFFYELHSDDGLPAASKYLVVCKGFIEPWVNLPYDYCCVVKKDWNANQGCTIETPFVELFSSVPKFGRIVDSCDNPENPKDTMTMKVLGFTLQWGLTDPSGNGLGWGVGLYQKMEDLNRSSTKDRVNRYTSMLKNIKHALSEFMNNYLGNETFSEIANDPLKDPLAVSLVRRAIETNLGFLECAYVGDASLSQLTHSLLSHCLAQDLRFTADINWLTGLVGSRQKVLDSIAWKVI